MIKLSNIAITHISLVKSGANGKSIIYKSSNDETSYEHNVKIKKTDSEKGMIYGIVYSPDEVDSQGDFATADEIEKASWAFMKAKNTGNIDTNHDFENVGAYVVENWITKENDSTFPDEPVGSWAVGIFLESDELRKMAKNGEIAGLSMAGTAEKTEVSKALTGSFSDLWEAIGNAISGFSIDVWTSVQKGKDVDMDKFQEQLQANLKKATAGVEEATIKTEEMAKDAKEAVVEQSKIINKQAKEIKSLMEDNKAKDKILKDQSEELKALREVTEEQGAKTEEIEEALKKSSQANTVKKKKTTNQNNKGIM